MSPCSLDREEYLSWFFSLLVFFLFEEIELGSSRGDLFRSACICH